MTILEALVYMYYYINYLLYIHIDYLIIIDKNTGTQIHVLPYSMLNHLLLPNAELPNDEWHW